MISHATTAVATLPMIQRGYFWRHFLGNILLLAAVLVLGARLVEKEFHSRLPTTPNATNIDVSKTSEDAIRRVAWVVIPIAVIASAIYAMWVTRNRELPLETLTEAARSLARGELSTQVPIVGTSETAALARAMNRMRDRLARHLETIDRQRLTLESIVAQVHEGVVVADPDGRIFTLNPAAIRLLDLRTTRSDDSFEGMPVEQCVLDHELQQMLLPHSRAIESSGRSEGVAHSEAERPTEPPISEMNIQVTSGGMDRSLLARASDMVLPAFAAYDDRPEIVPRTGRLLVLTDITEFSKTIQVKADFAANASHELRTPLSAIRMAVETLHSMDLAQDAAPAAHFLDVIGRHSRRLEELVKDLLDLSRVESQTARFEREEISTNDLLEDLRAAFSGPLLDKELRWETEVAPDCTKLMLNPLLIRLTLTNLIENAIKFTAIGGFIRISVRSGGRGVEILVSDNGCGIAAEEQARVFERFYQVLRARTGIARGTGLGLSIVRHAVVAMGGEVSLSSVVGEGTTVIVTVPRGAEANRDLIELRAMSDT